jgi:hypothetical protein
MIGKCGLAAMMVLASTVAAVPAQASETFDFTFAALLGNGDTALGKGTLTTDDADALGQYHFTGATGSYYFDGYPQWTYDLGGVDGFDGNGPTDGYLFQLGSGAFTTTGIAFTDGFFPVIGFAQQPGGRYNGFFSEVGVDSASLSFARATAAVPEPASWALMLLGFGLAGAAMRRRPTLRVSYT